MPDAIQHMGIGVTVARLTLNQLVKARILDPQFQGLQADDREPKNRPRGNMPRGLLDLNLERTGSVGHGSLLGLIGLLRLFQRIHHS